MKVSGTLRDLMATILNEEALIDDPRELPNVEKIVSLEKELVIKCGFPPKPLSGDFS